MADFEQTIAPSPSETVTEVAPGVVRVVVPVPFRGLGAVNGYLLRGPDGWTIVDTGLQTPDARAAWREASAALGIGMGDVEQVVLTHHHPDHIGLAGRFQAEAGAQRGAEVPVWLSAREQEIVDIVWTNRGERNEMMEVFFARCGTPDPAAINFSDREVDGLRQALEPFPTAYATLVPGETVTFGDRMFVVMLMPGHSDGHCALYDPSDSLLLVGDHVLPHITPNIARWPGVAPDPLGRYLSSLADLHDVPVRLALPGHGDVIHEWRQRLDALLDHHAERLDAMEQAVGDGATVFDVARQVFATDRLDRHQLRMAVAETLAHLEHLMAVGRLHHRAPDPDSRDPWIVYRP